MLCFQRRVLHYEAQLSDLKECKTIRLTRGQKLNLWSSNYLEQKQMKRDVM
jgi:hypothetical protein